MTKTSQPHSGTATAAHGEEAVSLLDAVEAAERKAGGSCAADAPAVAVSACLAGVACSYKCGHHLIPEFDRLREACALVYVCPETQGGLLAPREPAEIVGEKVLARDGADVTDAFESGARAALAKAREAGCKFALLKEKSPSCGYGRVYDGTFTGTLVEGDGVAARLFAEAGIEIFGESRVSDLLERVDAGK